MGNKQTNKQTNKQQGNLVNGRPLPINRLFTTSRSSTRVRWELRIALLKKRTVVNIA